MSKITDIEKDLEIWAENKSVLKKQQEDTSSSEEKKETIDELEQLFEEDEKRFQDRNKKEELELDDDEKQLLDKLKEGEEIKEKNLNTEEELLLSNLKKGEDKDNYDRNSYIEKICRMTKKQPLEYKEWSDEEIKQRYNDIFSYETKIIIGSPKDMPFGCLSNSFQHYMVIDDKYWATVSNYIYSNMLFTPVYKLVLQNTPTQDFKIKKFTEKQISEKTNKYINNLQNQQRRLLSDYEKDKIRNNIEYEFHLENMDITKLYLHYKNEEYENSTIKAVNKAYSVLLESNDYLQSELLKTGNSIIIYESKNKILGMDGQEGRNSIGIILMQLRHLLRQRKEIKQKEQREREDTEKIIKTFYVYRILSKLKPHELEAFKDKTLDEIYEYGKDKIVIIKYDDPIITSYKRGLYPEIERMIKNPNNIIISFLESKKIKTNPELTKTIIFQTFCKYVISKNFPNMPDNDKQTALSQLLLISHNNLTPDQVYKDMENKVYDLYNTNKLPGELISLIQSQIPAEVKVDAKVDIVDKEDSDSSLENPLDELIPSYKSELIKKLSKHTGRSERHYRKKSIEDLENRLSKYEPKEEIKMQKYNVFLKLKNNKKVILGVLDSKDEKEITKLLKKYNSDNDTKYTRANISVSLEKIEVPDKLEIFNIGEEIKVDKQEIDIIRYDKDSLFSPIRDYTLIIDNLEFPNISSYITTCNMCLMYTKENKPGMASKGVLTQRKIRDAYDSLKQYFNNPDLAIQFYEQERINSENNAFYFFTKRAIGNKFNDVNLRNVLYLTGDKKLIMKYIEPDIAKISCNAMMKLRKTLNNESIVYKFDNFTQFLDRDVFINSWIEMRTEDICSTMIRFHKFLNINIDMTIANIIMDNIYKSCTSITNIKLAIPPKSFVSLVLYNLSDFMESSPVLDEIEMLEKRMRDMDDFFYGIRTQTIPEAKMTIDSYNRKLLREFDKFKEDHKNDSELIEQEQKRFERKFKKFVKDEKDVKQTFEQKQRHEWIEFLNEINEPELSKEKILEEYNKYATKLLKENDLSKLEKKGYTKEQLDDAKQELLKQMEKAKAEKLKILTQPKISDAERNKRMLEFRKKQEEERILYYGVNIGKKTKEEIQKHNQMLETIKHDINELYAQRKEEMTKNISSINNIAGTIWTKLIAILTHNTEDIKKIKESIIEAENKLNNNLICEEPKECIRKALLNVIIGIYNIKNKLNIDNKFFTVDIDLASSIILNTRFEVDRVIEDKSEVEYFEEKEEDEEWGDDEENKSDIEFEFEEPEDESNKSNKSEFGMIYKESEIGVNLETITGEGISQDLINYFNETVDDIAKRKNKINRINFFSVL